MIRFKMSRSNWLKGALGIGLAANCSAAADLRLIEAIKHRDPKAVEALVSRQADIAYSERCRSAFRGDGDRGSELMPIAIPR